MNDALPRVERRVLPYAGYALLIASPFLLLLILSMVLGQNVLNAHPVWQDELGFWRSMHSWNAMGLRTGYYGTLEDVAPLGTLGISGLGPILIYGWFARIFGMAHNTLIVCNAIWISLAALVFCAMRKPSPRISFSLAALVLCYAPLVLYSITSMTECFNYALMLFYLTFLLCYQEKRRVMELLLCVLTVVFGCLYRPMYAVLFIPIVLFFSRYRFGGRMIGSAAVALALSILCCYLAQLSAAPNAQGFVYHLLRAPDGITFIRMLLSHMKANLIDYFARELHSPMQTAFRYLYCGLMAICLVGSFLKLRRTDDGHFRIQAGYFGPMMSCFLLLAASLAFTVLFYETYDWRDFRRLAPCLFLVIAYLIARRRLYLPTLVLGACVVMIGLLTAHPEGAFLDENRFTIPMVPESMPEVVASIQYDENAEDPFDNTIRTDLMSYPLMEKLHPGLGLQYGWFTPETTGKSRWVLTDQLKCPLNGYESVLDTGDYKLYRKIVPLEEE